MIIEIRDQQALSSISIINLRSYLGSRGWNDAGSWAKRPLSVFTKEYDSKTWEVLVPHRESLGGYSENMASTLQVLTAVEQRSQLDIFYDLKGASADVIRVHSTNGLAQKQLSVAQSTSLLSEVYRMVAACARAAEKPQAAYRGKTSSSVQEFLDNLQPVSRPEGYDITLHSPVPVEIGTQSDLGDDYRMPFARQVTYKLAQALERAEQAVEQSVIQNNLDTFKTAVPQGISANLCASVSELARQGKGIYVDLEWAFVRPANIPNTHFQFTEDAAEVLLQASKNISQSEPSQDEEIIGQIVALAREPDEFDGRATIASLWHERTIRLTVKFEQAVYETVINAFRDQSTISLIGDVVPVSAWGYELRNPRKLLVLPDD